jgi:hypothetical protein
MEGAMSDASPLAGRRPVRLDSKTKSNMDRAIVREQSLSRMLMTYIVTGLAFMLLPGTFLGVWNLIKISNRDEAESIAPAWIQAHGHAQLFGSVGTFILGIGFYSIPKLRTDSCSCVSLHSTNISGHTDMRSGRPLAFEIPTPNAQTAEAHSAQEEFVTILTKPQHNSIRTGANVEVQLSSQTAKDLSEVLLHLHDLVRHIGEHGGSLV